LVCWMKKNFFCKKKLFHDGANFFFIFPTQNIILIFAFFHAFIRCKNFQQFLSK
jgi:hypothetical protein